MVMNPCVGEGTKVGVDDVGEGEEGAYTHIEAATIKEDEDRGVGAWSGRTVDVERATVNWTVLVGFSRSPPNRHAFDFENWDGSAYFY